MPFSTIPSTTSYSPSEPLPQHLDHKPVYALPYEHFDGMWANETDVRYISIGIAQYDPGESSIKTMRHTGKKWTRQAEELPLHRVIDMTLFLTKALFDCQDGIVTIPPNTFPNQTSAIHISREDLRTRRELARYDAFLERNAVLLKERLHALAKVLDELKCIGKT